MYLSPNKSFARSVLFAAMGLLLTACPLAKKNQASDPPPPLGGDFGGDAQSGYYLALALPDGEPEAGKPARVLVLVRDSQGNSLTTTEDIVIDLLLAEATGVLCRDSLCSELVSTLAIPSGNSEGVFFIRLDQAGRAVTEVNFGLNSARLELNARPAPPPVPQPAVALRISGPAKVAVATCAGPYRLDTIDKDGNVVASGAARGVLLVPDSPSRALGRVYSDSACTAAVSGFSLIAQDSFKTFWYRHDTSEVFSLVASDGPVGLTDGQLDIQVNDATLATKLVLGPRWAGRKLYAYYGATVERPLILANVGGVDAANLAAVSLATMELGVKFKGGTYPGTGGTCGTTLKKGEQCKLVMTWTLTASASRGTFQYASQYRFDYTGGSMTALFNHMGMPTPQGIRFSEAPFYLFPPMYAALTSVSKTFTLTNLTNEVVHFGAFSFTSAAFGFLGGTFPGTGGTCKTDLPANQACTIVVRFAPATPASAVVLTPRIDVNYTVGAATDVRSDAVGIDGYSAQ